MQRLLSEDPNPGSAKCDCLICCFLSTAVQPRSSQPLMKYVTTRCKRCYQVTSQHLCYGGRAIHRHPRGGQAQPCNGRAQVGTNRLHTFLTAVAMQPTLNPPFSPKKYLANWPIRLFDVIWLYSIHLSHHLTNQWNWPEGTYIHIYITSI